MENTEAARFREVVPQDAQTRRVLRALRHPSVDVLAHPTGRLIGRRRGAGPGGGGRAAAERVVAPKVNAPPDRLDLDDTAGRAAIARGHCRRHRRARRPRAPVDGRCAGQARRGWAERKDGINTRCRWTS